MRQQEDKPPLNMEDGYLLFYSYKESLDGRPNSNGL